MQLQLWWEFVAHPSFRTDIRSNSVSIDKERVEGHERGVSLLSDVRDMLRLNSLFEFHYNFNFDVKLLLLEGPLL